MKSVVARFTTYVQTCQQPDLVQDQTRAQSLFKCFFGGERRLGIRLRRARGLMGRDEEKVAPQPNPQSSLIPKNI